MSDFGFKYLRISSVRFTKESLCAFSLPLLFSLCAETNTYTHERAHNANIHLSNVWITCNFVNNGENCENILNMWIFFHDNNICVSTKWRRPIKCFYLLKVSALRNFAKIDIFKVGVNDLNIENRWLHFNSTLH